jgi:hypothetical protein
LPQLHKAVTENRKSDNPVILGFRGGQDDGSHCGSRCGRSGALPDCLAQERLHRTSDREIWLTLDRWAKSATHLRFDKLELLEQLAVLTPRPCLNLIPCPGVLAPRKPVFGASRRKGPSEL